MIDAAYSEWKRKAEHILPLGFAFTLTIFPKWLVFTLSVIAIIYGVFVSKRVVKGTLREGEIERGFSLGKTAYGVMIFLLLFIFHNRMQVVAGAWALLALGDGSATIAGTYLGRRKLPWNAKKSWAGLLAFLVVGTLACALLLLYTQATGISGHTISADFAAFSAGRIWTVAYGTTIVCALAETIDQPLDDNILIPALSGLLLYCMTF